MKCLYFLLVFFCAPMLLAAQHYVMPQKADPQPEKQEWSAFRAQTASVHNFADYCTLVERFPVVRAAVVKMRGGEKAHQAYIVKAQKYTWRIYRNKQGGLAFFRADLPIKPTENKYGLRIDKTSKN